MEKVCILGMSLAGKTCYIYALSHILQMGVKSKGVTISAIQNTPEDQADINDSIKRMLVHNKWPEATNSDKDYNFCVRTRTPEFKEVIPSLILRDYRGGNLQKEKSDISKYEKLMTDFSNSVSIIFLIDAKVVLQGIDECYLSEDHRGIYGNHRDKILAINNITYIESLLRDFKTHNNARPPVMIAITKSDLFHNDKEKSAAVGFVQEYIPSVFAKGSGVDAGICCVSLGKNLNDEAGDIIGELIIDTTSNIHLPFLFAVYNYLDRKYDSSTPQNQAIMNKMFAAMQNMFNNNLLVFESGVPAFATNI